MTTEVRFLNHSDLDNYISLFNTSDYLMKVRKTENKTNKFVSAIADDFNDPNSSSKYVGTFTDGVMTATVCGKFLKTSSFWYLKNSFNIPAPGLNAGVQYAKVFRSMCQLLQGHAEDNGYYGFYTRRPYTHAVPFEKLVNRFGDRYMVFHEAFYPAGTLVSNRLHKPFFDESETAEIDFLITLAMLRPELRIDILDKNHSRTSVYKKEDFETK
jgi:hypothetical protein